MSYLKFSVIIAFEGNRSCFERSMDYLLLQQYPIDQIEIVVINNSDLELAFLDKYEHKYPESVVIINCGSSIKREDALNIGVDYSTGDYIVFLTEGDVLNLGLFDGLDEACREAFPKLIAFKSTTAMLEDDYFRYENFDISEAQKYVFNELKKKKKILNELDLSENVHTYVFNRTFFVGLGSALLDEEYSEESTFVYPLLLLAESLMIIPEHGYCHYYVDGEESDDNRAKRISKNLKAQLELYGFLKSRPELYSDYYDLIDAHFMRRYYIHTIELFRGGRNNCLSIQQFQLMQITCIKLIPQMIDNDFIYAFPRRELDWLFEIYNDFSSEEQLVSKFCTDATVSVIMTTFNRAGVLARGIRNVLEQTWQNFELVIVNDNSPDDTENVILSFDDSRIIYIKNEKNKGVSHARNLGMNTITGEYVIYQDDDDFSRLDKLEKMMKVMERADEKVAAVYHETIMFTEEGGKDEPDTKIIPAREMDDVRKNSYIFPALLPKNFIALPAILLKKKCLDDVGYFDEELIAYEDWELCLRLSENYDFLFIKEKMYDYLRSKTGLISNNESEHREKVLRSLYLIDLKYEKNRRHFNIASNFKIVD